VPDAAVPPAAVRPLVVRLPLAAVHEAGAGLRALLLPGAGVVLELDRPGPVDLPLLDVLAGLRLTATRAGARLALRAREPALLGELTALARLVGLDGALALEGDPSGVGRQPGRQAQLQEQLRSEEVVHVAHPPS
jgi:hypothetical protein